MSNSIATHTVQVHADPGSLLNALRATFSNSTTVLSELLQNARRAGASRVDITVTDDLIVFQDDGCGIDDFSVLLSIAKSGWDTAVQRNDAPYGLGWLSTLFACEHVGVMSKGCHLYAATEDLLAVKPVPVNESADLGVTEIRLHQHRLGNAENLAAHKLPQLVLGFPIPVFVNGKELARPHALDNLETNETAVGHACNHVMAGGSIGTVYLQGLPIQAGMKRRFDRISGVLHLSSPRFKGRMPDREQILDMWANAKVIEHGISQEIRSRLSQMAEVLEPAQFLFQYADLAVSLGMVELVKDIPFAPANWLVDPQSYPALNEEDQYFFGFTGIDDVLSREDMNAEGIYMLDEDDDDESQLVVRHWIRAKGGYLMPEMVPDWHWLHEDAKVISKADVCVVAGEVLGHDHVDNGWNNLVVKVVDSLHVQLARSGDHADSMAIETCYDPEARVLYIASLQAMNEFNRIELFSRAADQVFEKSDDNEDEDDNRRDQLTTAIRMVVLGIVSQDPEALMTSVLSTIPGITPKQLQGREFVVSIDNTGAMSVTAK